MKKVSALLAPMVLSLFALEAHAATVDFTAFTGSWINSTPTGADPNNPVATNNGTSTPSLRWGDPADTDQSGYDFVAAGNIMTNVPVDGSSPLFDLGTFTHINNPIFPPSLLTTSLSLNSMMTIDGGPAQAVNFIFDFVHQETPNSADPCANGEANGSGVNVNGCGDIISVATDVNTQLFNIGGTNYTVTIEGFLNSLNEFADSFETIEAQTNVATLRAQVTNVPEPTTTLLLSSGLLAMGWRMRRQSSKGNK